ncbi:MAG: sigma-70 family RNA polymerase sigma factor [Proteobacteria bacterium]|nr:sigma-70 family RNA polymerase sigma factor [Pseudomonadota bacterium]
MDDANQVAPYDLTSRIAAGDRAAEREFVGRYAPGVRTLVRRHCRPGDPIVEDLAQDVLANVLMRLRAGAVRDAAALPAYIHSAVLHTTSAEYRKRRVEESDRALEKVVIEDSPPRRFAAGQLGSMLRALLSELPVFRDREVLRQFYLEELDRDEVCDRLGIDADHFHRVVFRARERLRGLLERAGITEDAT